MSSLIFKVGQYQGQKTFQIHFLLLKVKPSFKEDFVKARKKKM